MFTLSTTSSQGIWIADSHQNAFVVGSYSQKAKVTGFTYDDSKSALYIMYASTVIVRHVIGGEIRPAETVFSLKPTCRNLISRFQVFSLSCDPDISLLCVMVGDRDLCIMKLNHLSKTFKQAEIDLQSLEESF